MFILSCISRKLAYWSVNHTLIDENSELKIFKNITFLGESSNNWPNGLLGEMCTRLLNNVDNHCWQNYNGPIILKWFLNEAHFHHFHPYLSCF